MIRRRIGKVIVDGKPIIPITKESVRDFLVNNIDYIESYGYEPWIGGSCVYDFSTANDLDLYLLGEIRSIQELEDLLHYLYEKVFQHHGFRLDLRWCSNLESMVDWAGKPTPADIKFIQLQSGGYINSEEDINRSFSVPLGPNVKKISEWLIQGTWDNEKFNPKPKHLECWNKYKTLPKIRAREFLKSLD